MRDEAGNKLKQVRDYSNGSLRSKMAKAATRQELEAYMNLAAELGSRGELSGSEIRKLEKVAAFRCQELESQLVVPASPSLIVPRGDLIVEPGSGR